MTDGELKELRIGYEMIEGSSESIVLNIIAGALVRYYNLVPVIADNEGLVYQIDGSCDELISFLKDYLERVKKTVKVRFEDGWTRIRIPDIMVCR